MLKTPGQKKKMHKTHCIQNYIPWELQGPVSLQSYCLLMAVGEGGVIFFGSIATGKSHMIQ